MHSPYKTFDPKDPAEKLDYLFDWAAERNNNGLTNWLKDGESIVTCVVTVPEGIVLESHEIVNNNTSVVVWISGGTNNEEYLINCQIETATRTGKRSAILPVKNL